jgi:outer membrane protein OmpA-like peptidoglycan-associated protein
MKLISALSISMLYFQGFPAVAQEVPGKTAASPIYSVTVIARTTKAINYQYRAGPTRIDFRGTVLLPAGKGQAAVESEQGRTEIQAGFANLTPPTQYGREYLTYTLWAITPEGAPHNLGELIPDGSNKARLHVTTDLQAFGLIVTAEPFGSARQPSDVVVLENQVRPDTVGNIQTIQAKYELLPRGHYTWHVPDSAGSAAVGGPKVSMNKYEAQLELYEAQNAISIALAADAATYATNTIVKAETLLDQAQRLQAGKAPTSAVIQIAREAVQTAEDARVIAERRQQAEKLAAVEKEAVSARQAQQQAQAEARRANADADAARAQAEAERAARRQAEATAAEAQSRTEQAEVVSARIAATPSAPPTQPGAPQSELRMRLWQQLNGVLATRDTPRGLVVTLGDSDFSGVEVREPAEIRVSRLAAVLGSHPQLRVDVEGYTDSAATGASSWNRARAVQRILVGQGLPAGRVSAQGLGDERPLVANSTPAGRVQNRRVEIVISGEAIGTLPYWDRAYSLLPRR